MASQPILFYDSDCGFCNGVVQFVLRHERAPALMFAPINGQAATDASIVPELGRKTIVLLEDGRQLIRSRAAFRVMQHMGGGWKSAAGVLKFIPRPLADIGYRIIASIRRTLPAGESCALLPPEKRARFLE